MTLRSTTGPVIRMRKGSAIAFVGLALAATLVMTAGCTSGSDIPDPSNLPTETTSTAVFFSTGRSIVQESVRVDAADPIGETLKEMLKAEPQVNSDIAIVQTTAAVNSVELDEATHVVTVDWSADVLSFDAEPAEKRLAYASILLTLGQFPEVEQVRFTVDGKDSGVMDGRDIQEFWGDVSLADQPWDVLRPPGPGDGSTTETGTAGSE